MIDPSVSVPRAAAASPIAVPIPLPELDPDGSPSGTYGLVAWPPRPENPDGTLPRKCAHSERFAFPRRIAPAARSFAATCASRGTTDPSRANEPAVVFMPVQGGTGQCRTTQYLRATDSYSCMGRLPSLCKVAMLSLRSIGIPCRGPRGPSKRRSRSSSAACLSALGFISMTALSTGPCKFTSSILAKYAFVIAYYESRTAPQSR